MDIANRGSADTHGPFFREAKRIPAILSSMTLGSMRGDVTKTNSVTKLNVFHETRQLVKYVARIAV